MEKKSSILFIMNPISGTVNKSSVPKHIEETLDKNVFDYSIKETEYSGHAYEIAKAAAKKGFDFVIAVGGDGTVNEVGRALTHTNTAMGIIPCGSGNGLARHLMIPLDIKKSIEIINKRTIHKLDYGMINDYPFFCTCGMGFDAYISMKFAKAGKRGAVTYLENILREGVKYKAEKYIVECEGESLECRAFLISCANASQYGNNAYIAPQASMSDGLLDVIIMDPFDLIDAPQISLDMFNKTLDKNPNIRTFKTTRIHVKREAEGLIHYDGDPVMSTADVDIKIINKGINIIVNPNANKAKRHPNLLQTVFSDIFNDISIMRSDISKQSHNIQVLNKNLLKKLNN